MNNMNHKEVGIGPGYRPPEVQDFQLFPRLSDIKLPTLPSFRFSSKDALIILAVPVGISLLGITLGSASASGLEYILFNPHNPQLVTSETLTSLYKQTMCWSAIVGGTGGLIQGFRS